MKSHTVLISNVMDATGIFNANVYVPFEAKYCHVRVVAYDAAHELVIVRTPFVQGGTIVVFADNTTITPNHRLEVVMPVRGLFEFRCCGADLQANVGMNAGEIAMLLEFTD